MPVAQDNDTISVECKPFGVGLSFTPLVLSEGRISLKIATEVSEISNEGADHADAISLPGLKVRRANTTVELPSGGSLVIAGLISDDTRQNIDGVPGLKNLPILGTLFRSRDFQKQETELVVIVTPYMVNPVAHVEARQADRWPDPGLRCPGQLPGPAEQGLRQGGGASRRPVRRQLRFHRRVIGWMENSYDVRGQESCALQMTSIRPATMKLMAASLLVLGLAGLPRIQ